MPQTQSCDSQKNYSPVHHLAKKINCCYIHISENELLLPKAEIAIAFVATKQAALKTTLV